MKDPPVRFEEQPRTDNLNPDSATDVAGRNVIIPSVKRDGGFPSYLASFLDSQKSLQFPTGNSPTGRVISFGTGLVTEVPAFERIVVSFQPSLEMEVNLTDGGG